MHSPHPVIRLLPLHNLGHCYERLLWEQMELLRRLLLLLPLASLGHWPCCGGLLLCLVLCWLLWELMEWLRILLLYGSLLLFGSRWSCWLLILLLLPLASLGHDPR